MHEVSIAMSLLDIIRQELAKHGATRLLSVEVHHGVLANIVPEALEFAFQSMTIDTEFAGARLTMVETPLTVRCGGCGVTFSPEPPDPLYMPCPTCGLEFGHTVLTGKELYLERIEAE